MARCIPVSLPGGVLINGKRECDALLRPIDGLIEERIAELTEDLVNFPAAVSQILGEAMHSIAGRPADSALAASLCIADRQWLMLALARQIQGGGSWLEGICGDCGGSFDLYIDPAHLPVQPAGNSFPYAEVDIKGDSIRLHLPTGTHQENIAGLAPVEASTRLLTSCIIAINNGPVPAAYADTLGDESVARIEEVLEAVSPFVGTAISTGCPECGNEIIVDINPYFLYTGNHERLFEEVHEIARNYHWSEEAILALPRTKRLFYLRLIARDRTGPASGIR